MLEALGSKYKKKHVGNSGDAATFSFFANKTVTTEREGLFVLKSRHDEKSKTIKRPWHVK